LQTQEIKKLIFDFLI